MKYHRKLKSVSSVSTNKRAVTEACLKNIKWHRQVCSRAGSYKQTDVVLFVSCFLALSVNMWADVGCVPEERWTGISQSGSCCSGDWESERRRELAHRDRTPPSFTWNKLQRGQKTRLASRCFPLGSSQTACRHSARPDSPVAAF